MKMFAHILRKNGKAEYMELSLGRVQADAIMGYCFELGDGSEYYLNDSGDGELKVRNMSFAISVSPEASNVVLVSRRKT